MLDLRVLRPVCVDASLIAAIVLPEPEALACEAAWRRWLGEGRAMVAPPNLGIEAISSVRRAAVRGSALAEWVHLIEAE